MDRLNPVSTPQSLIPAQGPTKEQIRQLVIALSLARAVNQTMNAAKKMQHLFKNQ